MERMINLLNPWWREPNWTFFAADRVLLKNITPLIERDEIIVIKGPRQAGKTYLLYQLVDKLLKRQVAPGNIFYFSLDDEDIRNWISKTPREFTSFVLSKINSHRIFIFLDEFQKAPNLTEIIKIFQDSPGKIKFFLSGSSSLQIAEKVSESLLGRTISFLLYPLSFSEYLAFHLGKSRLFDSQNLYQIQRQIQEFFVTPNENLFHELTKSDQSFELFFKEINSMLQQYLLNGGYPRLLNEDRDTSFLLLKQIKNSYIEKDILKELKIFNIDVYEKLMTFLAFAIGSLLNVSSLAGDLAASSPLISKFLNVLKNTFIVDTLPVFSTNKISSLKKAQKIYFNDIGFRNLLTKTLDKALLSREIGPIMENFVFDQLKKYIHYVLNDFASLYFWRNSVKNEIDFIFEYKRDLLPIEIKHKPQLTRGMMIFMDKLALKNGIIVNDSLLAHESKNGKNIYFIPLSLMGILI
ncbi:MAG: ATP-binding protein [candidate division KSB1 bacterium]|nr:ATP-binding protein [candidate division KSB1 bacterium]